MESDVGIPRNFLITIPPGVLPVNAFSFPLLQQAIRRRKKTATIFFIYRYFSQTSANQSDFATKLHLWSFFLDEWSLLSTNSPGKALVFKDELNDVANTPSNVVFAQHLFK